MIAVFDYDGTLVDTETSSLAAWQQLYRERGCELTMVQWASVIGTNDGFDPAIHLSRITGEEPAMLRLYKERLHHSLARTAPLRPGVQCLLEFLSTNDIRCGIVSNASREWIVEGIRRNGVEANFSTIIDGNLVRCRKPDPEGYIRCAREMGSNKGTWVAFEDSPPGGAAAIAAGYHTFIVSHPLTRDMEFHGAGVRVDSFVSALRHLQDLMKRGDID